MFFYIKDKFGKDIHLLELLKGGGSSFMLKIFGMIVGYILAIFITNNYGAHFLDFMLLLFWF